MVALTFCSKKGIKSTLDELRKCERLVRKKSKKQIITQSVVFKLFIVKLAVKNLLKLSSIFY